MIIRRQGDGLDSKLRSAALTARLARTAELFAAGRARRGAGFAEEVHTVVAEEERVGRSGTTLAPGRFEGAEFRGPVGFGDAFGFLADEARGDFTDRKRYGQDVAGLGANFQRVLADQGIQFGGAVQVGGGHAATPAHDGIRVGGAARDALSDLAQQVLIVGVDALGVARQAAVGVLFDGGGQAADFGLHGAQRNRKKLRQFVAGNRRLWVILQIVLHRLRQEFRLRYQGAGRRVEADGDDTEAGFVALDGVVKAEEVVARALLVVFDHTIDAVLQRQSAVPLHSAPEPADFPAIAFRWPAFPKGFRMRHCLALFRQLQPQFPARLRLAIERLRYRRRSAHRAESQDLHLKIAAVVLHSQEVAGADLARRFGGLSVGLNPAEFTCPRGQRAGLEESGGPEPLVHSHAGHDPIVVSSSCHGRRTNGVLRRGRGMRAMGSWTSRQIATGFGTPVAAPSSLRLQVYGDAQKLAFLLFAAVFPLVGQVSPGPR